MTCIHVCARLIIADGKLAAFKELVGSIVASVRALESGQTLAYEFYLSEVDNPISCLVYEQFVNDAAFLQHIENFKALVASAADIFHVERSEMWGNMTEELKSTLSTASGAALYVCRCAGL